MAQWRKKEKDETYSEEEIEARLKEELPNWYYEGGWIRRKYKTSGWKGTLMVVNTVGHLAEAAWHHPDLTVSYAFVIVKLMNHAAKGVTDKDFELAKKIAVKSPLATSLVKENINHAFNSHLNEGLSFERKNFYLTFSSQDQKEGMNAFLEKRSPEYKGN